MIMYFAHFYSGVFIDFYWFLYILDRHLCLLKDWNAFFEFVAWFFLIHTALVLEYTLTLF